MGRSFGNKQEISNQGSSTQRECYYDHILEARAAKAFAFRFSHFKMFIEAHEADLSDDKSSPYIDNQFDAYRDTSYLEQMADKWGAYMDHTFLACSILSVPLAVATATVIALAGVGAIPVAGLGFVGMIMANIWNGVDAWGAWRQSQQFTTDKEEDTLSRRLLYWSGLVLATTIPVSVGFSSAAFAGIFAAGVPTFVCLAAGITSSVAASVFAGCMAIGYLLERHYANQTKKLISQLSVKLNELQIEREAVITKGNDASPELEAKITATYNLIQSEKLQYMRHKANAKVWGACTLIMTAVATLSIAAVVLGASCATAGILPALAGFVCAGIGYYRWSQNRKEFKIKELKKPSEVVSDGEINTQKKELEGLGVIENSQNQNNKLTSSSVNNRFGFFDQIDGSTDQQTSSPYNTP